MQQFMTTIENRKARITSQCVLKFLQLISNSRTIPTEEITINHLSESNTVFDAASIRLTPRNNDWLACYNAQASGIGQVLGAL